MTASAGDRCSGSEAAGVPSAFWSGRRVLVTGASGFTGRHLCRRLDDLGASVRAFVRPGHPPMDSGANIEVFPGDLRTADDCVRSVQEMDTVFHLAAVFRRVAVNREELAELHVAATERLVRAAAGAGCRRFVHCSTVGVHGHMQQTPGDEESPFAPGDDYQQTKLEGERAAFRTATEVGLPLGVVRPCGIYGPGDTRFVKLVRPIARRRFVMIGPGKVHWHPVHVRDLVEGFLLCAEKEAAVGQAFLVGGPEYVQLRELVRIIARIVEVPAPRFRVPVLPVLAVAGLCQAACGLIGVEPPLHPRRVAFFLKNRAVRIDKARRLLGYTPRIHVEEGFRNTIAWYREQGYL